MDKRIVFRNVDIKKYILMPVMWLVLEIMFINIFPDIPRRAEYVGGMTFALRLIMGGGILVIFLYEFEFMVLRENRIVVWQWLIPIIDVKFSRKPYVAATIKYRPSSSKYASRYKDGRVSIDLSYEYKLYFLLSSLPVSEEEYYYDSWKEVPVNTVNGVGISSKTELPRVRYCENYHNAFVEYYGCEIGESYLIDCYKNNVIL